jgi:hypothetical protein
MFQQYTNNHPHLVDHEHRLDTLTNGLTQHRLGLDADAVDGVHHHQRPVRDPQGRRDLGGEVDVAGRVNEVDEVGVLSDLDVGVALHLVLHGLGCRRGLLVGQPRHLAGLHVVLEEHGDAGGLDGDAALGLVLAGVGVPGAAGGLGGDDAGLLDEGVGEGGFAVVDVGDDGHAADVVLHVHDGTHLVYSEVYLASEASKNE